MGMQPKHPNQKVENEKDPLLAINLLDQPSRLRGVLVYLVSKHLVS